MANFAKYSRGASGHLLKHYERAKDSETGEYVRFGNQDIDPERSHLNYNLAPEHEGAQYSFIKERCEQVHCMKRADVNVLGSWVITAPEGMKEDQLRPFFQASYDALEQKYGRENVVSAYVHMDESGRPHMHFAFVPVVYDQKKNREKVNAKECVSRADLKQFHPWLETEVSQRLGYQVQLMNEATKDGNKTITELKQQRELAKQAELQAQTKAAEMEAQEVRQDIQEAQAQMDKIQAKLERLKSPEKLKEIEGKKSLLGNKVTLDEAEFKFMRKWALNAGAAVAYGDTMQAEYQMVCEKLKRAEEYAGKVMGLTLQNAELQRDLEIARKKEKAFEELKQQVAHLRESMKEDLSRMMTDYTQLREAKKEAWSKRSEAEAKVQELEYIKDNAPFVQAMIARMQLLGATQEAAEAAARHEKLCAAVRAEKHRLKEHQAELMEQKAQLDKTLQRGVQAATEPPRAIEKVQKRTPTLSR